MGDRIEGIKVDGQVFCLGNCTDVYHQQRKRRQEERRVCQGSDEFSFDMLSLWYLQDFQVEMNSKLLDILTKAQKEEIYK